MSRLLIVANRLPIAVTRDEGGVRIERSAGGLATGLSGHHARSDALWIGWPGEVRELSTEEHATLARRLEELRSIPVELPPEDIAPFYENFSNGLLWPLFHHLLGMLPLHGEGWESYARVNQIFADEVCRQYQPGDRIWVHDYHLMLLPALLRERLPEASIGFFLHIPFPASEIFRTVPHREQILKGLLGADLVGFHTAGYMRSFSSSLLGVLGIPSRVDRVEYESREVRLGVFPMGVDAERFGSLAQSPAVEERVAAIRKDDGCAIFLGVDRLDYTKGLRRRFSSFEMLLEKHPELHGRVRLVQVAVPSRTGVEAYQEFRGQVNAMIGHINGRFGTPAWTPLHYIYRSIDEVELVALYRAADVMLVTPVRDGMNLVAKEFIASRIDEGGVLVLSEFAGAAAELAEAVMVNPFDVERTAEVYHEALSLPPEQRVTRMRGLRRRVLRYDVHTWVRSFLESLEAASGGVRQSALSRPSEVEALVERMRVATHLVLLLGYDGTLIPFASAPELSVPDEPLVQLLHDVAERPRTEVHVISGSSRAVVEKRFPKASLHLHAEYGFWSREPNSMKWRGSEMPPLEWRDQVREILEGFAARTPGSLIEEKTISLAWHYRMADPEFGEFQAHELTAHLTQLLSNLPVEIVADARVVEVRATGVSKGNVLPGLLAHARKGSLFVAMGDGRTDEELFAALPQDGVAIHVGSGPTRAQLRLRDVEAARRLLRQLLVS